MDIIEFPERHYVGARRTVTMDAFAQIADRLPEVLAWLTERGGVPAGAPFFRFHHLGSDGNVDVEVGWPVAEPVAGEGEIFAATLPAGRYASETHVGHPDRLFAAIEALQATPGLDFDLRQAADGEHWGSRLEIYKTDPEEQPDMTKWEVELQFRLRDPA
ncbi:GyrI-like domain-containing protein [Nonomuraea longicatena]|uniref:GyrI-like domain-containing protein n=1 Tax=Nonomuraea longicatena TaxID=83682 RepID=A0ABP3ZKK1_9ACTN